MTTTTMAENITVDLDQLLGKLSNTLLSPTADDTHLRTTLYERNRISANVEYARTLLLRLEHNTADIKTQSRKSTIQADLQAKRDLIKKLNTRLIELNQLASLQEDSDSSSEEEDEEESQGQKVREFAPAVSTSDTLDTDPSLTSPQQAAQDLANNLRSRKPNATNSSAPADSATTSALFNNRSTAHPTTAAGEKLSTEQVLDSANRDQDILTTSLVALAQSLKQSSLSFASSLDAEKEILRRAEGGLDKNSMGMEAAGNRMDPPSSQASPNSKIT
ncbi:hypothetical protein D6C94_08063 [Aureobasidium pullulans]|uniref:Uncharacterized protein n=1 Tax=Aureobasidium pullulans TaxID=5580 RepID=A0AB38LPC7_AURPU|nr:hypothetical protein D6C94_08063 [Aureobasidium pullulans]